MEKSIEFLHPDFGVSHIRWFIITSSKITISVHNKKYLCQLICFSKIKLKLHNYCNLKSPCPIDRKCHGHSKNNGFVLYEYIIKQYSSFCKYTNISIMKKKDQIK